VQAMAAAAGKKAANIVRVPRERIAEAGGDSMGQPAYFGVYLDVPPITEVVVKAKRILGFQPTPFETGLRETYRWYLRNTKKSRIDYSFRLGEFGFRLVYLLPDRTGRWSLHQPSDMDSQLDVIRRVALLGCRRNRVFVLAAEAGGNEFPEFSLADKLLGSIAEPSQFRPVDPQDGSVWGDAVISTGCVLVEILQIEGDLFACCSIRRHRGLRIARNGVSLVWSGFQWFPAATVKIMC